MAVHVLTMLAKSGEDKIKSERVAGSVNTNPVVIRRLLGQLNQANLVDLADGCRRWDAPCQMSERDNT